MPCERHEPSFAQCSRTLYLPAVKQPRFSWAPKSGVANNLGMPQLGGVIRVMCLNCPNPDVP